MHIIGILTSVAFLIYWVTRAAGSVKYSGLTAGWKRKKRWDYSNVNSASKFDEIETTIDAATALMVAVGRDSVSGELSSSVQQKIVSILENDMGIEIREATAVVQKTKRILRDMVQADSVVLPASFILRDKVTREEARQLGAMLAEVLALDTAPSRDKVYLLSSYKERMGLDG